MTTAPFDDLLARIDAVIAAESPRKVPKPDGLLGMLIEARARLAAGHDCAERWADPAVWHAETDVIRSWLRCEAVSPMDLTGELARALLHCAGSVVEALRALAEAADPEED
jgi:hypothetical protein